MNVLIPLAAVAGLFLLGWLGAALGMGMVFGVWLPYLAVALFLIFLIYRVMSWANVPVPFRIPTTCGQQKSLPWVEHSKFDCPVNTWQVVVRMALEILTFRSLFRNTRMKLKEGGRISYQLELFLWAGALAFHYAFLVVLIRHLRFFIEPVPFVVQLVENVDSFFRMEIIYPVFKFGLPGVFISGFLLLAAVSYLFLRRLFVRQVKYISIASDYFPLFLIFGIAFSGIFMRYVTKVDVTAVKELTMGLITFQPTIPAGVDAVFFVHIFFVSVLLAYFPFSKLMHLGGIFMSPTRNLANTSRVKRHVNPWNYPVKIHTYEAYEDDFREKMIEAGLPVEKMMAPETPEEPEEKE